MKRLSEGIFPCVSCAIVIMVLMGLPGTYFPTIVIFWDWLGPDKIIHLILFGLLSFLSLWGYRKEIKTENICLTNKALILTLVLTISYGAITEVMQKYVFINRYGCIYDFIADAIGCILGVIIFIFHCKKKLKKTKFHRTISKEIY